MRVSLKLHENKKVGVIRKLYSFIYKVVVAALT